jgi:D-alanine transaminase
VPEIAYVNGEFMPLDRAVVPVEDRGYQFADAVYEVLRTYGGRLFAVDEHLDRLWRSLEAVQLTPNFSREALQCILAEALRRAAFPESLVYVQISRGAAKRHRGVPVGIPPTVVVTVRALPDSTALRERGITCITVPDQRWGRCDIKSVALLANVLAYQAAKQAGADDAIFVEGDGTVHEATAGNVFLVRDNTLITPVQGPKLLGGITREKLLQAAGDAGITAREQRVTTSEIAAANEMFISSTTAEVVPVRAVDGRPVGAGRPGPVAARLYAAFVRRWSGKNAACP